MLHPPLFWGLFGVLPSVACLFCEQGAGKTLYVVHYSSQFPNSAAGDYNTG
ncbi:hypothetical protein [Thioflexithrix psekupsensis]|uniref:hypothetical protein n=1 Tax=Thioflexithrix psekupsensis TaxID=1570016 RepID=UPI0015943AAF|nr:hypothetical protein [Thioflexithrix psekupsensis]